MNVEESDHKLNFKPQKYRYEIHESYCYDLRLFRDHYLHQL